MPPDESSGAPPEVVDRLYGVSLEEFVPTRAAAARKLRGEGHRDQAAAVQALPKPSVAAWIVNRLARDEESLLADLLAAGARLRDAQLSTGATTEIRAAGEAEREALDALMRSAAERGSAGSLDRVRETLHAAALDPDLAEQVRRGVLVREQQAAGFPFAAAPEAPRRPGRASGATASRGSNRPRSSKKTAAASRRLELAAAAAEAAQEALAAAETRLTDARQAQEAAEGELADAEKALAAAERRAGAAKRAAERAAAERERAAARAREAADRQAAAEE